MGTPLRPSNTTNKEFQTPRRTLRNQHVESVQKVSSPLHIPPSPMMKKIGYGTGVQVYKLERGGTCSPWAVKKVTERFRADSKQAELFNSRVQNEAQILRKLCHPNIVGFRGITPSAEGVDTMAMECCTTSLGDILEERYEEGRGPLPAPKTLRMIVDIARALDYLHSEVRLLHGDLKSYNVLVKGDFEICKLCDFGVSIQMNEQGLIDFGKHPELIYVGTDHWSAPEVIDEAEVIDCKADIFSFGLVVYETIALVPPHALDASVVSADQSDIQNDSENAENSSINDTTSSLLTHMLSACGTRPPLPEAFDLSDEYNRIVEIFYLCTNALPEDRPLARTIWQSLNDTTEPITASTDNTTSTDSANAAAI